MDEKKSKENSNDYVFDVWGRKWPLKQYLMKGKIV